MYEEKLGVDRYTRLEDDEIEKLVGKRAKGVGKITCVMNAEGEVHPTLIKFGDFPHHTIWTLEEFLNSGEIFDGRNKNEVIFNGGVIG